MGREKTTAKRIGRNSPKTARQKNAHRAIQATLSSLAPQRHDAPHQGPADYEDYEQYSGYEEYERYMDDTAHADAEAGTDEAPTGGELSHERARELIVAQTTRLLPPAEANALADHLLICDDCYRFAQDVAAQRRNAHANS